MADLGADCLAGTRNDMALRMIKCRPTFSDWLERGLGSRHGDWMTSAPPTVNDMYRM